MMVLFSESIGVDVAGVLVLKSRFATSNFLLLAG